MAITQIRLDTQTQDATLTPAKITTSATADFTFPRDITSGRNVKIGDGSAGLPSLTFTNDSNTGFFSQGADSLGVAAGGTEYLRVGTTYTQAFNAIRTKSGGSASAPDLALGAANFGFFNSGSALGIAVFGSTVMSHNGIQWESFSPFRFTAGSAGVAAISLGGDPTTGIFHPSSGVIAITSSGTEAARIDSLGVKAINGTAANPSFSFTSDPDTGLYEIGANQLGLTTGGVLQLSIDGSGNTVTTGNATVNGQVLTDTVKGRTGDLALLHNSGFPAVTLSTSGYVLIENDGSQGTDGNRYVTIGMNNGVVANASAVILDLYHDSFAGEAMDFGYTMNGSGTGIAYSWIRGGQDNVTDVPLHIKPFSAEAMIVETTGDVTFAHQILADFGSSSTPGYAFAGAPDTGISVFDTGGAGHRSLQFSIDGTRYGHFTDDGTPGFYVENGANLVVIDGGTVTTSAGSSGNPGFAFNVGGSPGFYHTPGFINVSGTSLSIEDGNALVFDGAGGGQHEIYADSGRPNELIGNSDPGGGLVLSSDQNTTIKSSGVGTYVSLNVNGTDILHAESAGLIVQGSHTLDMNNNMVINVADPVNDLDAANKRYVDSAAAGLDPKASSRVATTTTLTLTTDYTRSGSGGTHMLTSTSNGVLSIDGVNSGWVDVANDGGSRDPLAATAASRVLVKDASDPKDNGIYAVQDKGSVSTPWILVRATDQDGTPSNEVSGGNFTFIEQGTMWASTGWTVQWDGNVVVETDPINWIQFSAAGVVSAGNGLTQTGETINVVAGDASITVDPDDIKVHRDSTGAIGLSGSGIAVNVDGSTLEINTNALRIKDAGVTYAKTNIVTRETPSGTVDGSNAVFTLANSVAAGSEHVYLNGILMDVGGANDYTISGSTITFNTAPSSGSKVRVTYWKA